MSILGGIGWFNRIKFKNSLKLSYCAIGKLQVSIFSIFNLFSTTVITGSI